MNNNDVILRVENLSQHFKLGNTTLKAVDNVSFEIKKGEVFGLVGESGCGKTTTGRSIIKIYNSTGGNVYFKDQRICAGPLLFVQEKKEKKAAYKNELKTLKEKLNETNKEAINSEISELTNTYKAEIKAINSEIKKSRHDQKNCDKDYSKKLVLQLKEELEQKIANLNDENQINEIKKEYDTKIKIAKKERLINNIQMIFQDPIASLNPRMTVRDIIAEGLILKGIKDNKYIDDQVNEMLELVGLVKEHASRYPHEFSGGQRQRIGIARAVIMKPSIIIADEPISALDVSIQAQVINLLNDLRNKLGLTILFIAHDLSVVKYFSDSIGVMYFGKMVERASSDDLFKNPLHPYTRSLLSAIPLPDPIYEKKRQRFAYNPLAEHDYTVNQPTFREVTDNHFVLANDCELEKYKEMVK